MDLLQYFYFIFKIFNSTCVFSKEVKALECFKAWEEFNFFNAFLKKSLLFYSMSLQRTKQNHTKDLLGMSP